MHRVPEINLMIAALLFTLYNRVKCSNKSFLMTVILYSHRNFTCNYENKKNNNSPNLTNRQCLMLKSRLLLWLLEQSVSGVSASALGWSLSWLTVLRALALGYYWHSKWQLLLMQGPGHLSCKDCWKMPFQVADHLLYTRCSCASSNLIAPVIVGKERGAIPCCKLGGDIFWTINISPSSDIHWLPFIKVTASQQANPQNGW